MVINRKMTKKPVKEAVLEVFEEARNAFPYLKYETTPKQSYEVLVMEFLQVRPLYKRVPSRSRGS